MRNEADIRKRDIVGNIFPSVTILGGAVLTGMSFPGRLDGNARFVVGMGRLYFTFIFTIMFYCS